MDEIRLDAPQPEPNGPHIIPPAGDEPFGFAVGVKDKKVHIVFLRGSTQVGDLLLDPKFARDFADKVRQTSYRAQR